MTARTPARRQLDAFDGLVIDLFAGGGGASAGIEAAIGRPVDIAINHDHIALAVHKANHPHTQHVEEDIWRAKPRELVGGRKVALLWASPDCTHFSLAKGGKPRSKNLRTLAWAVCRWAKAVCPEVIFLENVTEFQGWGPLKADGTPDKRFMGKTFRAWRRRLERLGYVVECRVLDASLYGAPTRRKRLFIIARRDGEPIVWPAFSHGPGRKALHTAAECIDWQIPCRSIFDRKRPLADKTQWRIAKGIERFVLDNPRPFLVNLSHGGRLEDLTGPMKTITATPKGGDRALVVPHIVGVGGRAGQSPATGADAPLGTITAKNDRALIAPHLLKVNHGKQEARVESLRAPLSTVTATQRGHAIAAATLIQTGYGEDLKRKGGQGQKPRIPGLDKPIGTIVAGGSKHALVAAFLAKHFGDRGQRPGLAMDEPLATVTSSDHHALTAAHLVKLRGECHSASVAEPMPVLTSGGTHIAEVRAFLLKYYGTARAGPPVTEPMHTITAKDRLGLVVIEGVEYEIGDITMRMLEPHELAWGQFGPRFAPRFDLSAAPTKAAKVKLIGNSVCPDVAEAIVRANPTRSLTIRKAA